MSAPPSSGYSTEVWMENSSPPVSAAIMSATARTRPTSSPPISVMLAELTASGSVFSSAVK